METRASACPLDCPDACSLEVQVEDGRVKVVDGGRAHPVTAGFICAKVRRFPRAMYGEHRVLRPAMRTGPKGSGAFRDVAWEEALETIAARLAEARDGHGGESILPFSYGGSNGVLSQDTTDARLFRRLGASQLARTVCAAPTGRAATGLYGNMPGVAYPDYAHARLIVLWGVNPSASGIHLIPFIREATGNGAKLVVVDPRRTPLAAKADLHLAPRPGTDLPLALAVHRLLFEAGAADAAFLAEHAAEVDAFRQRIDSWTPERAAEVTGVTADAILEFARLYAAGSPAVVRCGWGLERNRNGGSAAAAVLALPAVAGKFGVRGGGYTMSNSGAFGLDSSRAAHAAPPATRTVNMNRLGEALEPDFDPRVRVLFVYNCNPLATMPNQERVRRGLLRDDLFTVVFDSFRTDTARYADVVLPAASFLERREISRGYGSYAVQDAPAAVPPVGESRTNHEVFLDLCRRLGLAEPGDPETEDAVAAAIFSGDKERLGRDLAAHGHAEPDSGGAPVQFADVFPRTADGKVHLVPAELDAEAPEVLYTYRPDPATNRFPLALISPATSKAISSTLGQLDLRPVPLELHPTDAASRGISDGAMVRVWNELGEVHCAARHNEELLPGVVLLPKGLWSEHTRSGNTANALAPDTLTDLAGGACFNDARVQVEAL